MRRDNECYPELNAKEMSKNGLDNVLCLRSGDYPTSEEAGCQGRCAYQGIIDEIIVDRLNRIMNSLGIQMIPEKEEEGDKYE